MYTADKLNALMRQAINDGLAQAERDACVLIHRSLRPRLRWAGRRPRALKLLKRLRLWTPPPVHYYLHLKLPPRPDRIVVEITKHPLT